MQLVPTATLLAAFTLLATPHGPASDPIAVYALIDEVEVFPTEGDPQGVRLTGAFALAEGSYGDYYRSPRWGVLELAIGEDPKECRAQWADLQRVAGTGECVGFGSRRQLLGLTIQADDSPRTKLMPFSTGIGVQRIRNASYGPIMALTSLPRPVAPLGTLDVARERKHHPGQWVTLRAKNCKGGDTNTHYLFEVERSSGDIVASPAIEQTKKTTEWRVFLPLEPGERVTWRVRALREGLEVAPVASATFTARASG